MGDLEVLGLALEGALAAGAEEAVGGSSAWQPSQVATVSVIGPEKSVAPLRLRRW